MTTTKNILIVLFAGLIQQCSYSQSDSSATKKENMDNTEKKHPLYSRTDTTKVNVSDKEWEKILPKNVFHIAYLSSFTIRYWLSLNEKQNK